MVTLHRSTLLAAMKIKHQKAIASLTMLLVMVIGPVWGCKSSTHDARLDRIDSLAGHRPEEALELLSQFPADDLSSSDRHFRDFLEVKVADKAYIPHTSDSLILSVLDYYSKHDDQGLYPEVLYYCGRVYSDLGDLPTALHYFERSLDELPDDADPYLRRRIVSQTGRLLNNLRLYDQALPYLEESLRLSETECDSDMIHYDYQLLGSLCANKGQYDKAETYLRKALEIARQYGDAELALMEADYADFLNNRGQTDLARKYIYSVTERAYNSDKDYCRAVAADVYYKAGKYDSAYYYAHSNLTSTNQSYRITSLRILLKPELRPFSSEDTLKNYVPQYLSAMEQNYNQHDSEAVMMQNAKYNYTFHEREREKLSRGKKHMTMGLVSVVIICLALGLGLYISKRVISRKKASLSEALTSIDKVTTELNQMKREDAERQAAGKAAEEARIVAEEARAAEERARILAEEARAAAEERARILAEEARVAAEERAREVAEKVELRHRQHKEMSEEMLRNQEKEINRLINMLHEVAVLPDDGRTTEGFRLLYAAWGKGSLVLPDDPIWDEVRKSVLEISPDFDKVIGRLALKRLSRNEYQLALMIRLGFASYQSASLTARRKATISYHRNQLREKLFNNRVTLKDLDKLICLF